MAVSETFRTYVLDQMGRVATAIRSRPMFGGVGIYSNDFFFALIDDDVVYLKVDDSNRPDFQARGLGPFRPFGEDGEEMSYYALSEDLLEDPEELRGWVEKAVAVARAKQARRSKGRHK